MELSKPVRRTSIMKALLLLLFKVISTCGSYGQQCESCKKEFDKLLITKKKEKVNQADLEKSWEISKKLYTLRYTNYIDSVANNTLYVSHSLTKTFFEICIKAGSQSGVDYYLKYLTFTNGSAEEERSFALERLFVKFPVVVLNRIGKNEELLNDLVWGFLNNRSYGAKNPFEDDEFTAMTVRSDAPRSILNKENCRSIFFETNPKLKEKQDEYKYQIDYIINTAIKSLKENE